MGSPTSFQSIPSESALDYVRDALADFTVPANSNAGLTDHPNTNPTGSYFANDNSPKLGAKTLWVKDIVLEKDPAKWIYNPTGGVRRPSYRVIWNEEWPGAVGYVSGDVVERQLGSTGKGFEGLNRYDMFGVSGVIRRLAFLVQPVNNRDTLATIYVDNVLDTAITVKRRPVLSLLEQKTMCARVNSVAQTRDIHDYKLISADGALTIVGVIVFYDITGSAIDQPGGETYVNKESITTVGTSLAIPTVSNLRGAVSSIYVKNSSDFGVTTSPLADIAASATGSSGTNTVTVGTGLGASFPAGSLVYMTGTTTYFGNVLSVSTDTLTLGVTLPIGYASTMSVMSQAGYGFTIPITQYDKKFTIDFNSAFPVHDQSGSTWPFYNSENLDWRVWGSYGVTLFPGNIKAPAFADTNFLQIDGNYDALSVNFIGQGVTTVPGIHATFNIDGLDAFNILSPMQTWAGEQVVLTNASSGFHSVRITAGASTANSGIQSITGWRRQCVGSPSFGVLADVVCGGTFISRLVSGTQKTAFGNVHRVSPDSMEFTTGWVNGVTLSVPSGVAYYSASSSETLRFTYYGSAFAVLGALTGGSYSLTVDGAIQGLPPVNSWIGTTLTEGFHLLEIAPTAATLMINGIDYLSPQNEILNLQRFYGQEFAGADEQTIEKNSWGTVQLKDGGITPVNRQKMYVGSSVGIGGLATVPGLTFSLVGSTFQVFPESAVTITTSGNPVMLQSSGTNNSALDAGIRLSNVSATAGAIAQASISIKRAQYARGGSFIVGITNVFRWAFSVGGLTNSIFPEVRVSPSCITAIDTPDVPGVYSYYFGASTSAQVGQLSFTMISLTAKEMF